MNKGLLAVVIGLSVSSSALAAPARRSSWVNDPMKCGAVKDVAGKVNVGAAKADLTAAQKALDESDKAERALDDALKAAQIAENHAESARKALAKIEAELDKMRRENPTSKEIATLETNSDKALKDAKEKEAAAELALKETAAKEIASDTALANAKAAVAAAKNRYNEQREAKAALDAYDALVISRQAFAAARKDLRQSQEKLASARKASLEAFSKQVKAFSDYRTKCNADDRGDVAAKASDQKATGH